MKTTVSKCRMFVALVLFALGISADARDGFAIVIDRNSYNQVRTDIEAYASCVESVNNLKVYWVVDDTGVPDSIRHRLHSLHGQKSDPIVGAVLVGDIPVAMIRDAQFMTSAFKMNQERDRRESSVPSDRFYDSFSLRFQSLGKDSTAPYYYYSLTADGSMSPHSDIFSGRIRPTDAGGTSKTEKLRAYLRKVVAEKQKRRTFDNMFFFSGHGYISESKVARMDEKQAYFEHFPELKGSRNAIGYLDHTDANPVKERLMNELMRKDLSLAVLHHHGYSDTQYLNGTAPVRTVKEAKAFIVRNGREHVHSALRRGKNADSLRAAIENRFDLPSSWLADAFSDSLATADSLHDAADDLHLEDFRHYGYKPNVPVVLIDACFCGSYHLDDCIANEYIFQEGSTVAVVANTVNVLQDKWADRFVGLIDKGGCVGHLVQLSSLLESHVIGDPTFNYRSSESIDVSRLLRDGDAAAWRKLVKNGAPDIQALAVNRLGRLRAISSDKLYALFRSSPYGIVRLESFLALASLCDDNFIKAVGEAASDSYELLQRQAIRFIAKTGDGRLVPPLIRLAISNNTSERCNFNVMTALSSFPQDVLMREFSREFSRPDICYIRKDSVRGVIGHAIGQSATRLSDDLQNVMKPDVAYKDKVFAIRAMRNTMVHHLVPPLLAYLEQTDDARIQTLLLEAFGWHPYSCMADEILAVARRISETAHYPQEVRMEALKTMARINEK